MHVLGTVFDCRSSLVDIGVEKTSSRQVFKRNIKSSTIECIGEILLNCDVVVKK